MKVKDLLRILSEMDPNADVLIAAQPSHPMEYAVGGVALRSDFAGEEVERGRGNPEDVLLLEGTWLRYGWRDAWDHARTL